MEVGKMPDKYTIDPNHSRIEFSAKHLMVTTVRGHFTEFTGEVELADDADLTTAQGKFAFQAASLDSGNPDRDTHLRSDDFLGAQKYPQLTFESTRIEKTGDSTYRVTGDLTIRETTRPVTLDVEVEGQLVDPWGNERVGVTARGKINRKDWGLNWNMALEAGGVMVSDNVNLVAEVALVRKAAVPAIV
ncbi:MAG: YceI family protein [Chloroflexota bacterium]